MVAPVAGLALSTDFTMPISAVGVFPQPPPQLLVQPPPPPGFVTVIGTVEELLVGLLSVELDDSPTKPRFVIVVPAVPAFTPGIVSVAVELKALASPIVQIPVELA